jgi:hypothetical protein
MAFSSDTISFDTVFSTIGSTTRFLTVTNPSSKKILISSIHLANDKSFFKLNIDGISAIKMNDIEIMPNDSMYIFVQVNVDPQNENNPIFIEDALIFEVNGSVQSVILNAYGQDVIIIKSKRLETSIWDSKKPYLIFDSVLVSPNSTLTIEKGTEIFCHDSTKIKVYGNIIVNGTVDEPVIFRGDRLDEIWEGYRYDYATSQWSGIEIFPSNRVSTFNNCTIKNAIIGLYVGDAYSDEMAKVELQNTIIHNNSYSGVYAINSDMVFKNCQISNSGFFNLFIIAGGNYNFYQCTIANFFGLDHNTKRQEIPCLTVTNAVQDGKVVIFNPLKNANFYNCIIDGNLSNEVVFQVMDSLEFNFMFYNCAVKVDESIKKDFNANFSNCFFNDTIQYLKIKEWDYNFQLDTNSFAINKGNIDYILKTTGIENDLKGNSRTKDGMPDLGAYEFF